MKQQWFWAGTSPRHHDIQEPSLPAPNFGLTFLGDNLRALRLINGRLGVLALL